MINRFDHSDTLYDENNSRVFGYLSELLQGSLHAQSLRIFSRKRDERKVYLALVQQKFGKEKWEQEIDAVEKIVIDNSWDGKKAGMILHKHISNRHVAQNMLEKVAQNTEYSPPNEHLRIKRLLK